MGLTGKGLPWVAAVCVMFPLASKVAAQDKAAESTALLTPAAEAARKYAGTQPPKDRLRRVQLRAAGAMAQITVDMFLERLADGLWGTTTVSNLSIGPVIERKQSLEGLLDLAVAMELNGKSQAAGVIPIGKGVFLPFAFQGSQQTASTVRTLALSGDLQAIGAPVPGATFAYEQLREIQTASRSGMLSLGSASATQARLVQACTVGDAAPATQLHPGLRGEYLPVKCTGTAAERSLSRDYAYLRDAGVYLQLRNDSAGSVEQRTITAVEYE